MITVTTKLDEQALTTILLEQVIAISYRETLDQTYDFWDVGTRHALHRRQSEGRGACLPERFARTGCTCTESDVYAYVYPFEFGTIYLCGVFWQTTTTGTDSRGGTLIHESSHFTIIGSTQDYVYGQSSAKSLASSNPSEAIDNADNHEYFAENNPSQS
ncbi:lysine-specific metallo-endopeptidase-domain-containing protein [Armillaria luteobubalina]|uniref:Lysine-specific metallo-endopeptidase-domain-containing protein n=1 Tax=Armillaria luteobubalina TaxID=153913 RepID=A0AA39PDE4_9AGAR|nr:lysine-specific metallo-endopeptidase-domain-containing protein [Armillaria luteobubalina]